MDFKVQAIGAWDSPVPGTVIAEHVLMKHEFVDEWIAGYMKLHTCGSVSVVSVVDEKIVKNVIYKNMEECLVAMRRHSDANPDHGVDCACKDEMVRQARVLLNKVLYGWLDGWHAVGLDVDDAINAKVRVDGDVRVLFGRLLRSL